MSGERSAIFDWAQQRRLAPAAVPAALRLAGVTPDASGWPRFVDRLLLGLGVLLVAAGAIFFGAFNWQELGRFAKFALAEIPIVVAIAVCWRFGLDSTVGKSALFAAALFTGALLALVGQVYQTGADNFELFVAWALAITVWVAVARLPALVLLWLALLHAAIYFYFDARGGLFGLLFSPLEIVWFVFALDTAVLIAWEGLAAAGVTWLRERWAIRVVAFLSGGAITALAVWSGVNFSHTGAWPLVAYALWLACAYWAYRHRSVDLFILAGGVLSVIVVMTVLLAMLMLRHDNAGSFLLIGLAVIGGATVGAWWLRGIAAGERT